MIFAASFGRSRSGYQGSLPVNGGFDAQYELSVTHNMTQT